MSCGWVLNACRKIIRGGRRTCTVSTACTRKYIHTDALAQWALHTHTRTHTDALAQ